MAAFLFLRVYEDSSYKSSSMKSVRAAAIMFVSVTQHHSAKHLNKCAQLLRFSISLKFKNLHWMLVSVRLYLVHLDSACLKCFKTSARNSVENIKKAVPDPFLRSAPHSKTFAQMCTIITLLDELKLQKRLNACLRKVITRTLKRFLNLKCPAVSDLLRFRFFIQLRSQRAARVMWSLPFARFGRKLPQHPVVLIWKKFLLKIKFSKLQQQYPNGENLIKQLFHSRLLDMRLVIANSALRASLAIYHLISNARSWND